MTDEQQQVQMPKGLVDEVARCEELLKQTNLTPMQASKIRLDTAQAKRRLVELRRAQVRVVQSFHRLREFS